MWPFAGLPTFAGYVQRSAGQGVASEQRRGEKGLPREAAGGIIMRANKPSWNPQMKGRFICLEHKTGRSRPDSLDFPFV
jgi:hypothetical protein